MEIIKEGALAQLARALRWQLGETQFGKVLKAFSRKRLQHMGIISKCLGRMGW